MFQQQYPKIDNVRKIALLQPKALGDFIVLLPALQAIRDTYPDAETVYLGNTMHQQLLAGRPSPIDRVVVVPPLDGVRKELEKKSSLKPNRTTENEEEIELFFNQMRKENFDIAIHFRGDGTSSNPFLRQLHPRLTAGMANKHTTAIDRSIPYIHYQNEVIRNLEIASLIGAEGTCLEPELAVTGNDKEAAKSVLDPVGLQNRDYLVMHSGADDIRRMWPIEKWAELGDTLADQGLAIVLTGTPKEAERVQQIQSAMRHTAVSLTDISLSALIGVLSGSKLVISNDTGPLHVARAVGASTVGLFWQPNMLNWGPLTRNRHRMVLSWQMQCPNCGVIPARPWPFEPISDTCSHLSSFIDSIEVGEVLEAATELLDRT